MKSIWRSKCTNCENTTWPFVAFFTDGLCLLCRAKIRHASSTKTMPADQEQWSEASKRSRSYVKGADCVYRDEYYWCANCGKPCVFTAADQKQAYEVEKRYIFQQRKLCNLCYKEKSLAIRVPDSAGKRDLQKRFPFVIYGQ
jgi:hypothetical protein